MASDPAPFRDHRRRFLEHLRATRAAALVFTASAKVRNHDSDYRFRPESDFWYLTGFAEPEAVLVLLPGREAGESVLFLRERVPAEEQWTGRRLGLERAPEVLGVAQARPIARLWEELPDLLKGYGRILYRSGQDEARDRGVLQVLAKLRMGARGGVVAPGEFIDPAASLHEQRLFKSEHELALMRRAAELTAEAHLCAMAQTAPGVNEAEIDALLDYTYRRRGGTGSAYTNIVAGGANACILHYNENDQPLRDGDLLLIDSGAEWRFYAADVTRTFPVGGRFSAEQRALYEVVLDAQKKAIAHTRAGNTFVSVHEVALRALVEGLVELGLLEGSVEAAIESKSYQRFYMHRTGHWLGLDVHDQGAYYVEGRSRELAPGMVTTVEPGLYVSPDDESVAERWRGIGIRIEDDVAVTAGEPEVLTSAIPKEIDELEAACAGAELQRTR